MDEGFCEDNEASFVVVNVSFSGRDIEAMKNCLVCDEFRFHQAQLFFRLKMCFFLMDAFDFGLLEYDVFRLRLLTRMDEMKKYRVHFRTEVEAIELLIEAALGEIDVDEDIEEIFTNLYDLVFPS